MTWIVWRCPLGWGMTRMGPRDHTLWLGRDLPPVEQAILGLSAPVKSIGTDVCVNGWTDQDAVWGADSCGPKELFIRWGEGCKNPFDVVTDNKMAIGPPFVKITIGFCILALKSWREDLLAHGPKTKNNGKNKHQKPSSSEETVRQKSVEAVRGRKKRN